MTADTQKDWAGDAQNASKDGEFKRDTNYIGDRIVASISNETLPCPCNRTATASSLHVPAPGHIALSSCGA